jgi:Protein of unknown function (DUF3800)
MLRGFFDESGHHAHGENQKLLQFTIGGCIAPTEAWTSFKKEWASLLDRHAISWFHRKDYNDTKDKLILDEACKIIMDHKLSCYGSTIFIPNERRHEKPKRALATMYEDCAVDMIWHSARHAEAVADQIDLVFARLGEFSLDRLEKNFGDFQLVDRQLHSINVGDPKGCMPLQAADFVAYDVQRYHRAEISNAEVSSPLKPMLSQVEWRRSPPTLSRRYYLQHPLPDDVF